MWLINAATSRLEPKPFYEPAIPPYAILSHTWGNDEVDFQDIKDEEAPKLKAGWSKIENTCDKALGDGLRYVWVDTCCIDKSSSAELSEAINSMFFWYGSAAKCYVFLSDYEHGSAPEEQLPLCRWFTRGWTLQELLAPRTVIFYDQRWMQIGSKIEFCEIISEITSIPGDAILNAAPLANYSISQKMAWAAPRVTSRIEDTAYCLMGIFDITMPLLYGERHRAFLRLQEEILKSTLDMTLLAWEPMPNDLMTGFCSFLAPSPASFRNSGHIRRFWHESRVCSISARGLQFSDMHPTKRAANRLDLYIDVGKTSRMPDQKIVSIAVKMVGPGLYVRNGQLPLLLQANEPGKRRFDFQPLSEPVYLAVKPHRAAVSTKDSLHIQAHPTLTIFDGLPRKLWNEADGLFYRSRESNLRVLDMRGALGPVPIEAVVVVLFRDDKPHSYIFDRRKHPEDAAKLLSHAWSEYSEQWFIDSLNLSKFDRFTRFSEGGKHVHVSTLIKYGVVNGISDKKMWSLSTRLSEMFALSERVRSKEVAEVEGIDIEVENDAS